VVAQRPTRRGCSLGPLEEVVSQQWSRKEVVARKVEGAATHRWKRREDGSSLTEVEGMAGQDAATPRWKRRIRDGGAVLQRWSRHRLVNLVDLNVDLREDVALFRRVE
jgi:hypothetical protein